MHGETEHIMRARIGDIVHLDGGYRLYVDTDAATVAGGMWHIDAPHNVSRAHVRREDIRYTRRHAVCVSRRGAWWLIELPVRAESVRASTREDALCAAECEASMWQLHHPERPSVVWAP